jgi:hypothetical protein
MNYKQTPQETIVDHLKNFETSTSKILLDLLSIYHNIDDNGDKVLTKLVKEGLIERVSKGVYKAKTKQNIL